MALRLEPKDRLPWALSQLLQAAECMQQGPVTGENVVRALMYGGHPFDLPWLGMHDSGNRGDLRWFVGRPGQTGVSVNSMNRIIGWTIAHHAIAALYPELRIILAECDPEDSTKHDVYFETRLAGEVYLCGGCTDCSGEGSTGRDTLECVFELLAQLYNVRIERVTIPYNRAYGVDRKLFERIEAFARS